MKFCTECGYKLSGGEKFCPQCGFDLRGSTTSSGSHTASNSETSKPQQEQTPQRETPTSSYTDSTQQTQPSSPKESIPTSGTPSTLMNGLLHSLFTTLLPAIIVLGVGYFLYDAEVPTFLTLWLLLGGVFCLTIPFAKTWRLSWYSTVFPVFGIGFTTLNLIVFANNETDINYVLDSDWLLAIGVGLAVLMGAALGGFLGITKKVESRPSGYFATRLPALILIWGICYSITTVLFLDVEPGVGTVLFFCLTILLGSILVFLFATLFVRRYVLPVQRRNFQEVIATVFLLLIVSPIPQLADAQSFSQSERQNFEMGVIKPFTDHVMAYFKQRGRWMNWSQSHAMNRNQIRTQFPDRLEAQLAILVGELDAPSQSAPTWVFTLRQYRSAQAAKASVESLKAKIVAGNQQDIGCGKVDVIELDYQPDAIAVRCQRLVNNPRLAHWRITPVFSFGNWSVVMPGKIKESKKDKLDDLAKSIIYGLEKQGVRGNSGTSSARSGSSTVPSNSTSKRAYSSPGSSLPSDVVSGRSLGGGFRQQSSTNSNYNSPSSSQTGLAKWERRRNWMVSSFSSINSLALFITSILSSLGMALGGALAGFFSKGV